MKTKHPGNKINEIKATHTHTRTHFGFAALADGSAFGRSRQGCDELAPEEKRTEEEGPGGRTPLGELAGAGRGTAHAAAERGAGCHGSRGRLLLAQLIVFDIVLNDRTAREHLEVWSGDAGSPCGGLPVEAARATDCAEERGEPETPTR